MALSTDRLLAQLNQTQLAQKDNPLYQVIKQLIGIIKDLSNTINDGGTPGGGGSTVINQITQIHQLLDLGMNDSGGGDDSMMGGGGGSNSTPSGANHYDCPLSDGDLAAADLIFANGECIIVQVPV